MNQFPGIIETPELSKIWLLTVIQIKFQDATIKLWDFETGDYERTMKGHTDSVQVNLIHI